MNPSLHQDCRGEVRVPSGVTVSTRLGYALGTWMGLLLSAGCTVRTPAKRALPVRPSAPNALSASVAVQAHKMAVVAACFSPNERLLATTGFDKRIKTWRTKDGTPVRTFPVVGDEAWQAEFSPDGKLLVSLTYSPVDPVARVWDVASGRLLATLAHPSGPDSFYPGSFNVSGTLFVTSGMNGALWVWRPSSGTLVRELAGHTARVAAVVMLRDDRLISGSTDGTVRCWSLTRGYERLLLQLTGEGVFSLDALRDGSLALVGTDSGSVHLIRSAAGSASKILSSSLGGIVMNVRLSPDGRLAAASLRNGTIRVWSTSTGQELAQLQGAIDCGIDISPDSRLLAVPDGSGNLVLYQTSNWKPFAEGAAHTNPFSTRFSPSGRRVATWSADGSVRVFPVPRLGPAGTSRAGGPGNAGTSAP